MSLYNISGQRKTRGFSLIELAVVTMIAGIVTVNLLHGYRIYLQRQAPEMTFERVKVIDQALSLYFAHPKNGRYPCPADPAVPTTSSAFGNEHVRIAAGLPIGCDDLAGTGIRRVKGRLVDGEQQWILVGALPYRALKEVYAADPKAYNPAVSMETALDGWGNQYTYAVTESQTSGSSFSQSKGGIAIETEAGVTLVQPPGSGHFAIISHGKDGVGAYGPSGVISKPCPAVGTTRDAINCTFDEDVAAAPKKFVSAVFNDVAGANYFDDVPFFRGTTMSGLWARVKNPVNIFNKGRDVYSVVSGNIGIGTNPAVEPGEKLEIAGTVESDVVQTKRICDLGNSHCFEPQDIGGAGMKCDGNPPAGQIYLMTGIQNRQAVCVLADLPSSVGASSCPAGQYMVGVRFAPGGPGTVVCSALAVPP